MEEAIETLIATSGKSRDEVIRALEMANGSPDVAFEILLMDPDQLAQAQQQMMGENEYDDEEMEGESSGLAAFVNNP